MITVTGANDGPSVAGVISETASEDAASFSVDLLQGASDPDATDVLNVAALTLNSGDASGVTIGANSLTIDPSAYNHLAAGESETIAYSFNVIDGNGGTVAQTATITMTGANDGPSVTGVISETASEDAASFSVDLLQGASDPDASDVLNVAGLTLDSGDASGVTVGTNSLTIDPSAYNHLAVGESETIVYSFSVVDGNGGTVSQTATITVTGANDGPSVAGVIAETASEDAASFSVDLLQGASDPDASDVLNVDALTLDSGDASGVTVGTNSLTIDPSAYNHLAVGESETIVYSFNVVDGNGGSVSQTAMITVTGANDGPSVAGVIAETASEDAASFSVDLLQGASDPDASDVLNVAGLTLDSGDASGVTVGTNSLTIDPSAYNHLAAGESETIVYSFSVVDGNGGTVSQTATITVTGANDGPSVAGVIAETASEDAASFSVDLLQGASDPDTSDVLNVDALTLDSGDASGVTVGTNSLTIDPSAYNHLAVGESETIVYSFNVVDGNGGSVSQTAMITVTGANDGPSVAGVIAETASEDAASFSVDLLQGASDPDASDVLNVAALTLDSGDASGVTVGTNSLTIDPSTYNHLAAGESETIVYSFNVVDGNGGTVAQTATITVTGANDGPSVAGVISETASEDAASFSVDLLQGASDPDATDVLNVDALTLNSGDASGVTIGANSLTIDPSAYNHLAAGESETIVYSFNVIDGNGGVVAQTVTITIEGADDAHSIYVLNEHAQGALSLAGNTHITVGDIFVNSDSTAAIRVSGTSSIDVDSVNVVGGVRVTGQASVNPAPTTMATPVADPLASMPVPTANGPDRGSVVCFGNQSHTLSPGTYSRIWAAGQCEITMLPGEYTIEGGGVIVVGHASVTGQEVTIYNTSNQQGSYGGILLAGEGSFDLTPPSSGDRAGVVIFQDRDNSQSITLAGNSTLSGIQGTVYAPAAILSINGASHTEATLIVDRLRLRGSASASLVTDDMTGSALDLITEGQLARGEIVVALTDAVDQVTAAEHARLQDAMQTINDAFVDYGVTLVAADPTETDYANIRIRIDTTSTCGAMADGVLGCTESSGQIAVIDSWNWYTGSDTTQIAGGQYDFQTVLTHELGHVLGLGHSQDTGSVMHSVLGDAFARRELSTPDLDLVAQHEDVEALMADGYAARQDHGDHAGELEHPHNATAMHTNDGHDHGCCCPNCATDRVLADSESVYPSLATDSWLADDSSQEPQSVYSTVAHEAATRDVAKLQPSLAMPWRAAKLDQGWTVRRAPQAALIDALFSIQPDDDDVSSRPY